MPHSPFPVNILHHLLRPAVPFTWPALPRSCPLSSCRFSSFSQCFTPGKSALPSPTPTPSPLPSHRSLKVGVPLVGVCRMLGARGGQRTLPHLPRAGTLFPNAASPLSPLQPPGSPDTSDPAAAAAAPPMPLSVPREVGGLPPRFVPSRPDRKFSRSAAGSWCCPCSPQGAGLPAAPVFLSVPLLGSPRTGPA